MGQCGPDQSAFHVGKVVEPVMRKPASNCNGFPSLELALNDSQNAVNVHDDAPVSGHAIDAARDVMPVWSVVNAL
jgi:hypothetical protein